MISINYLTTWFFVDLVSVIPFDSIFEGGGFNRLARFSKIGRLYKVIKITKLARLIKTVKVRNKLSKHLTETLKMSFGVERMLIMFVTFMIL